MTGRLDSGFILDNFLLWIWLIVPFPWYWGVSTCADFAIIHLLVSHWVTGQFTSHSFGPTSACMAVKIESNMDDITFSWIIGWHGKYQLASGILIYFWSVTVIDPKGLKLWTVYERPHCWNILPGYLILKQTVLLILYKLGLLNTCNCYWKKKCICGSRVSNLDVVYAY